MRNRKVDWRGTIVRSTLIAVLSVPAVLPVLAPWLLARGQVLSAALIYVGFSPVCHQNPGRSFVWEGFPWAVCHRCTGIYLGLFLVSLLPIRVGQVPRLWILAPAAVMALEAALPLAGVWTGSPASRFLTGSGFGAALSLLLLAVVEQIRVDGCGARILHRSGEVGTS
jgi:uncharacterized membrane protein